MLPLLASLLFTSPVALASGKGDTMQPSDYPSPGKPTEADPHYDLEQLYADGKHNEGLKAVDAKLAKFPKDPELYWHKARFMFEIAEKWDRNDKSVDKKAHYESMVALGEQGLEIAPNHPHLLFLYGIAKGRLGTTRGVLNSLFMAKSVEQSWIAVANSGFRYEALNRGEMLPCDSFQTLGIFYRLVPESGVVKMLAGTRGDLDKSLAWHERSVRCGPGRSLGSLKELGVTQLCIGTKRKDEAMIAKGKRTLTDMQKLPIVDAIDQIDHDHAKTLVADPGLACGYSRDGQQDLDEKNLKKGK